MEKDRPFGNTGDENTLTSAIPMGPPKDEAEPTEETRVDDEKEHVPEEPAQNPQAPTMR